MFSQGTCITENQNLNTKTKQAKSNLILKTFHSDSLPTIYNANSSAHQRSSPSVFSSTPPASRSQIPTAWYLPSRRDRQILSTNCSHPCHLVDLFPLPGMPLPSYLLVWNSLLFPGFGQNASFFLKSSPLLSKAVHII